MKSLLVFLPSQFADEKPGYMYGRVTYDPESRVRKFYVLGICRDDRTSIHKSFSDIVGYFAGKHANEDGVVVDKKCTDWIRADLVVTDGRCVRKDCYRLSNIVIDGKKIVPTAQQTVVIVYDRSALIEAELFDCGSTSGNHFRELKTILENKITDDRIEKKTMIASIAETILMLNMLVYLYPVMFVGNLTKTFLPILKHSTLGLHLNAWLENTKWTLLTVIQEKKLTLKTGNHILATIIDVSLGVFMLRVLLHGIGETPPSQILLDNAEVDIFLGNFFFFKQCLVFFMNEFFRHSVAYAQFESAEY